MNGPSGSPAGLCQFASQHHSGVASLRGLPLIDDLIRARLKLELVELRP
jgi:hypothetical protein